MLARGDPYITVGGSRKESSWQRIEAEDLHQTGRSAAARELAVLQQPEAKERDEALQQQERECAARQLPAAHRDGAQPGAVRPHGALRRREQPVARTGQLRIEGVQAAEAEDAGRITLRC